MKAFSGETEEWTRCFLAALGGLAERSVLRAQIAHDAGEVADAAVALLAQRREARRKDFAERTAKAIAEVRRIARFVDKAEDDGSIFHVRSIMGNTVELCREVHDPKRHNRVSINVFELLEEDHGYRPALPAPETSETGAGS